MNLADKIRTELKKLIIVEQPLGGNYIEQLLERAIKNVEESL